MFRPSSGRTVRRNLSVLLFMVTLSTPLPVTHDQTSVTMDACRIPPGVASQSLGASDRRRFTSGRVTTGTGTTSSGSRTTERRARSPAPPRREPARADRLDHGRKRWAESAFAVRSSIRSDPASADRILGSGSGHHPDCRCCARRLRRRRRERRRADDTADDRRADDNRSADNDPPTDHYFVDCHDSRSDTPASRTSSRPSSAAGRPRGSSREPPEGIGGTQLCDGYPRRRLRCDDRGCRSRLPAVEQPAP